MRLYMARESKNFEVFYLGAYRRTVCNLPDANPNSFCFLPTIQLWKLCDLQKMCGLRPERYFINKHTVIHTYDHKADN